MRKPLALLAIALAAIACSGDDDAEPEIIFSEDDSGRSTAEATSGVDLATASATAEPPTASPTPEPQAPPEPGQFALTPVFQGFRRPVDLDPIPGQPGRYLVLEQQTARILLIDGAAQQTAVVADLSDRVGADNNEEGLLSLAFSPAFADDSALYVYYTTGSPGPAYLSRLTFEGAAIDPNSEVRMLEVPQPFPNHNGGGLEFGPDGYLYLGLGDGGAGNDPQGNGQDPGTILGSIHRLDVSGNTAVAAPDNPFVGNDDGWREETYAYGLRNPWRLSFDRATGALWVGDVGQQAWEEVDIIEAGGNYGWNIMEGPECLGGGSCDQSGLELPVASYSHEFGCSITGGYVYRGEQLPSLVGWYLYTDFCSGRVWATSSLNTDQTIELLDTDLSISSFAEDTDGELLVLAFDGVIYRLAAS
jgi:glucose/arabinose dehydrogenase